MSAVRRPSVGTSTTNGVAANRDANPTSPTQARHGRARHIRTNASLTSSMGSASNETIGSLPLRTSVPTEATRIFQATGFDPLGTEADTLFRSLSVKEVEAFEQAVRTTAIGKQEELRRLVGQRYEDLLGTANTIIDMADSSSQLSQRLEELSKGISVATSADEKMHSSDKLSRRKSYLPTGHAPTASDKDTSSRHQEAIYVLGASLRLLMDTSEYIWKSIEKGKTLQAAWAYMLARYTWSDLVEGAARSKSHRQANEDDEIASTSEAVSILKVNVRKTFPFIEKQWHSMQPMRKQIVHRAVSLLSDAEIESAAVADQLAALMLMDGTKFEQALQLLLSQRLTAMRRMCKRRRTVASSKRATSSQIQPDGEKEDLAMLASHTIAQVVTLYARTLQHAAQIFMLPVRGSEPSSSSITLLLDLLTTITESANFASGSTTATSPSQERVSLLSAGDGAASRQSAAALRALRRRSSHGLPTSSSAEQIDIGTTPHDDPKRRQSTALRVSTVGVIQALPSARVLQRLLPPSTWKFAPIVNLDIPNSRSPQQMLSDLTSWSEKARESLLDEASAGSSSPDTLRSLLSELSDVGELAVVRRSLRLALQRARKMLTRKLSGPSGSHDEARKAAMTNSIHELQKLEARIDSALQERLLHLMKQKLDQAVKELLAETETMVSTLQAKGTRSGTEAEKVDTPLDALFHSIEAGQAPSDLGRADAMANPTKASRAFAASLEHSVCGRSQEIDRLASLYERPLANLSEELRFYQEELEADENFISSMASIKTSFDNLLASSHAKVEKGLADLLDKVTSTTKDTSQVSIPAALVMRLIAILINPSEGGTRSAVKTLLRRFWTPKVEQSISNVFSGRGTQKLPTSTVSDSLLQALALLSDAIVRLGPALAGPEIAQEARSILESVTSKGIASEDAEAIKALLTRDASKLSKHLSEHLNLHRIRLALSPLMIALANTAHGPRSQPSMLLSRAEPASATGQVQQILPLSRKRTERFSTLPVR